MTDLSGGAGGLGAGRLTFSGQEVARSDRATAEYGRSWRADVLIDAIGIGSGVHSAVDDAAPPARYVPLLDVDGYAPPQDTGARPGDFQMICGADVLRAT